MKTTPSLALRPCIALCLLLACCASACTTPAEPYAIEAIWSDDDAEILVVKRFRSIGEPHSAWFELDVHDVASGAVTRLRDDDDLAGPYREAFHMRAAGYTLVLHLIADRNTLTRVARDGSERSAVIDRSSRVVPSPDGSVIAALDPLCWLAEGCDRALRLISGADLAELAAIPVHLLGPAWWDLEWQTDGSGVVLVPRALGERGRIEDAVTGDTIRVALDGTVTEPGPVPACEAREAGTTSGPRAEDGRYVVTTWDPETYEVSLEIRGGSSDRAFPGLCL